MTRIQTGGPCPLATTNSTSCRCADKQHFCRAFLQGDGTLSFVGHILRPCNWNAMEGTPQGHWWHDLWKNPRDISSWLLSQWLGMTIQLHSPFTFSIYICYSPKSTGRIYPPWHARNPTSGRSQDFLSTFQHRKGPRTLGQMSLWKPANQGISRWQCENTRSHFNCPWMMNHPIKLEFSFAWHPDRNGPEPVAKHVQMISNHWKNAWNMSSFWAIMMRFHAGSWSATSSHQQTLCQQRGRRVCLAALGWAPVLSTNSCRCRHVSSNYFSGDRDSQAGPKTLNS